jgi:hypothetical protein
VFGGGALTGVYFALNCGFFSSCRCEFALPAVLLAPTPLPFALLGGAFALVGEALAVVGEQLAVVGDLIALVGETFALVGKPFAQRQNQLTVFEEAFLFLHGVFASLNCALPRLKPFESSAASSTFAASPWVLRDSARGASQSASGLDATVR